MTAIVIPVVREDNGSVYGDSRDVAKYFNKNHHHVLRDIRNLLKDVPNLTVEFWMVKFTNSRGKEYDCYHMTKNGFLMLAMGFTGKEANQLRWVYIQEFDRMQDGLKNLWDNRHQNLMEAANNLSRIVNELWNAASQGGKDMSRWRLTKKKIEAEWIELRKQGQLMLDFKPGQPLNRVKLQHLASLDN